MNIFYVDSCPIVSAKSLCDQHVSKMTVETAQMLSTVCRNNRGVLSSVKSINSKGKEIIKERYLLLDRGEYDGMWMKDRCQIYWGAYPKHPCTIWAGQSASNWRWLVSHGMALGAEFQKRYKKVHKSHAVISLCKSIGVDLPEGLTPVPQAMPDTYKQSCPIEAYRAYYLGEKMSWARWNYTNPPKWTTSTRSSNGRT